LLQLYESTPTKSGVDLVDGHRLVGCLPDAPELADAAAGWSGAYVHIPFCARVCPYCDFAVVAGQDQPEERYVAAVEAEIFREADWQPLSTVYVGGGTPSHIDPGLLRRLLSALGQRFGLHSDAEVSLEANPEDWTPSLAEQLRCAGFNRVSFGAQSFAPKTLTQLGRRHLPQEIADAVATARDAGFGSINLDLIFGTPGESINDWHHSLERATELDPDHISCYALTVERGTELGRAVSAGAPAPDPDLQADQYEAACRTLGAAGLVRYEVSNWARPGHAVRYNLAVWAQAEYLGFGLGAHRFRDARRSHNIRRLEAYMNAMESGLNPVSGSEEIASWNAEVERLFLGIRRTAGVVTGDAGRALLKSDEGIRLLEAGVIGNESGRLIALRPLLTDAISRALLALPAP
jgi:putative oxygen-independent coproporphyrinogen III oxidase